MIKQSLGLARIVSSLILLKTSLQNPLLLRQIEIMLQKLIADQPQTHQHLDALQGKVINVVLDGLQTQWHVLVLQRQLLINPGLDQKAVAQIRINTFKLPKYILRNQSSDSPVAITGDYSAVLQLQLFFQRLEIDIYPVLTKFFGGQVATLLIDIKSMIAEQLSNLKRTALKNKAKTL